MFQMRDKGSTSLSSLRNIAKIFFLLSSSSMMVIPSASIALLHNSCISWRTTHSSNHLHSIVRLDSILRNRIHTSRQRRHSNAHSTTIQVLYSTTTTTTTSTAEYHTDDTTTQEQVDLNYIEFSDPMISTTSEASPSPAASSKPPVILLHGLLGQKRNFASLGTSLASQLETPRRIFALDLRNHGDNSHDWRDDMSYSHMADDVLGFINKMGLEQVVLVGHSMGGKVAHSLALSYPERVAGLVVMDIAPVTYTCQDASWSAVQDIIQALESVTLEQKTKRDVEMELRANVSDPALRAFVMTNLETRKGGSLVWKIHIDAISKQLDKIASFDVNYQDEQKFIELLDQEMMRYMGDTFVIKGGSSSFIKGSHMETISRLFPNYMLTTVKGAGHWVHAEAPEATLALLKTYLDR